MKKELFYESINLSWRKFLNERFSSQRNFYVLIGPPAVGKSQWIKDNIKGEKAVISKDDIIEKIIFPKYKLANKQIFQKPPQELKVGEEHPENRNLGKVISYTRFSRTHGKDVEERAYENAYKAGEELNQIYDSEIQKAISSGVQDIIVDAIHMTRSTRSKTIDLVRGDKTFKIIGVIFPHQGYEKQIKISAEKRAKKFLEDFGSDFDRSVPPEEYNLMYSKYEEPSESEGFDELLKYNRFKKTDKELNLSESKLSKYWKNRAKTRSRKAKRKPRNKIDLEWAKLQQEKSYKINSKIQKIFERDVVASEELLSEVEEFLQTVKTRREEIARKLEEKKAQLLNPKQGKPKEKLGNPYKDAKVTKKFPYSKDRTGGVTKVFKRRSKNAGGPTRAAGEAMPFEEE